MTTDDPVERMMIGMHIDAAMEAKDQLMRKQGLYNVSVHLSTSESKRIWATHTETIDADEVNTFVEPKTNM